MITISREVFLWLCGLSLVAVVLLLLHLLACVAYHRTKGNVATRYRVRACGPEGPPRTFVVEAWTESPGLVGFKDVTDGLFRVFPTGDVWIEEVAS